MFASEALAVRGRADDPVWERDGESAQPSTDAQHYVRSTCSAKRSSELARGSREQTPARTPRRESAQSAPAFFEPGDKDMRMEAAQAEREPGDNDMGMEAVQAEREPRDKDMGMEAAPHAEPGWQAPGTAPEPARAQMRPSLAATTSAILAATKAKQAVAAAKAKAAKQAAAVTAAAKAAAAATAPAGATPAAAAAAPAGATPVPAPTPPLAAAAKVKAKAKGAPEAPAAAPAAPCKKRPAAAMGALPELEAAIADELAKRIRGTPPLKMDADSKKSSGDRAYNNTWTRVRDFLLRKGIDDDTAKSYARYHGAAARAALHA